MGKNKPPILLYVILAFALLACLSCKSMQQKIEADIWNIEPRDGSIYRQVKGDDGKPYEEYIKCTDESARKFKAMHNNDLKKWTDKLTKECACD